ncbi:type II secretion system protein GspD [Fusobacterium sp. MFO224]|uniref:type II secretion system protein GspD n=1 Tax=Fusobacterium sp. MFO224 TaxID=3378070 RepID=UPI003854D50F
MKIVKLIFFVLITQNLLANSSLIEKTKEIEYSNNIENRTIKELCLDLSSQANILIAPNGKIEEDKINISKGEKSIYEILKECCYKNKYKIEEKEKYIYITKKNLISSDKGIVIGNVYNKKYKNNLQGVEIQIIGEKYKKYFSDENGKFILDEMPYGVYFISLKKEGYITEGELLEIDKKSNMIGISMEQKNIKDRASYKKKDNFVIEKVRVNNLKEIDIETLLQNKKNNVNISKNIKENIVYLSGEIKKVETIKKYLNDIDNNNKQVRITAEIIDITENLFEKLGFSWIYDENLGQEKDNISINILKNNGMIGVGQSYSTFGNLLKTFKNDEEFLKFSLDLLETTQDLKITSVPSIVTVNGEIGEIKITEEKIVGEEKEEREDNKTTYTPIFKEAGIVLRVVPEIMSDGLINLKLEIEASDFKTANMQTPNLKEGNSQINAGSKISRVLKTTLKVREGNEILIGGLKKDILKKDVSQVPVVSSIPIVGNLFKYKSKKRERVDLYIKLKVDLIKNKNNY